ncbi:MAG: hypothetical protein ACLUPF_10860 [Dorea sp.]
MATKKAVEAANTAENNEPLNSIAEKEKTKPDPVTNPQQYQKGNLSTQSMSLQKQRQQRLKGLTVRISFVPLFFWQEQKRQLRRKPQLLSKNS